MSKKEDVSPTDLEGADIFLKKLYEVIYKLSSISKTQFPRFKKLWNNYFAQDVIKPHVPRLIPFDKQKFLKDDDNKAKTLRITEKAAVDIFYSIRSIVEVLYNEYFPNSELFIKDFSDEDQIILPYICAKDIYGNLLEFLKLEHAITPLKYLIIGKNYLLLKLKGMSTTGIINSLKKSDIKIKYPELTKILREIEKDGIIEIKTKGRGKFSTLNKDLKLTKEGEKKYKSLIKPLLEWSTQIWRSFFNIRELNIKIPPEYKWCSYLEKVLPRSATQGFSTAHYVIKNLAKYYEMLIKEENEE